MSSKENRNCETENSFSPLWIWISTIQHCRVGHNCLEMVLKRIERFSCESKFKLINYIDHTSYWFKWYPIRLDNFFTYSIELFGVQMERRKPKRKNTLEERQRTWNPLYNTIIFAHEIWKMHITASRWSEINAIKNSWIVPVNLMSL